ncbi:MAG: hypothetical protein ACRD44_08320 [Bryobacteraceae bacterium]
MARVLLVHWNQDELEQRADRLRAAGHEVAAMEFSPAGRKRVLANPPEAIVIDLARLPSHGRDVAMAFRERKATRHIPLVFMEGDPEKTERTRRQLPDAVYTTWPKIRAALKDAIAHPPAAPVVPSSRLAGYSGTPLPKKLGIKAETTVALVNAPGEFERTLGALPDGVELKEGLNGRPDLILWFLTSRREMEARIGRISALADRQGVWFIWPKKASGVSADITQNDVRETGLAHGLVDFKVCAVDETWSGLWFKQRKK